MMKRKVICLIVATMMIVACCDPQDSVVPMGELDAFWRNQPVLGPHLQDGLWLYEIPEYWFDSDFPYKKRPFAKEVPFADRLSVVRLLGGYSAYKGIGSLSKLEKDPETMAAINAGLTVEDLRILEELRKTDFAYRDSKGKIVYQPHLIKERLQPYLEYGYEDFTIVLDNFPWDFSKNPVLGGYGNAAPPDDPEEWYMMVKELCLALKEILREEKSGNLRFRIGTEMNGVERFAGTEDRFLTHIDYTTAAVHEILPKASVNLWNVSGASVESIKNSHNVGMFRVLHHMSTQNNRKTGNPTPVLPTFMSASRYYAETNDLDRIITGIDEVWNYIEDSIPGYKDNFTREIHEFGALGNWTADPPTHNPDAFGNAMNLQVVMNLRAIGLDQLFHWNMLEIVVDAKGNTFYIPSTHAWGYNVLDYMAGGETYKVFPEITVSEDETMFTSMLSVFEDKAYLLVTAFNADRTQHNKNMVTIKLPTSLFDFNIKTARSAVSNNSNSIMYQIRFDLEKNGLLVDKVVEKPEYVSDYRRMITDGLKANEMVIQNRESYETMWKASLSLNDFGGQIEKKRDDYILTFDMAAPESMVIVLR
jgi:hypothetical protein